MIVHAFRGPGRIFGFTADPTGANLPASHGPWIPFKTLDLRPGQSQPGVDVDACLNDITAFGLHVTDAHDRITDQVV